MRNFHQSLRFTIAVIFTIEGAVLATAASRMGGDVSFSEALAFVLILLVVAMSLIIIFFMRFQRDGAEYAYSTTDDGLISTHRVEADHGYTSIHDMMGSVELDEPFIPVLDEETAAVVTDTFDALYSHPDEVFDVDASTPLYEVTTPLELVKAADAITENIKLPYAHLADIEIPEAPAHKPTPDKVVETSETARTINMRNYLPNPLADPSYFGDLQEAYASMKDNDTIEAFGKSYGLGARGTRVPERASTIYTKQDVKKMIVKYVNGKVGKPQPVQAPEGALTK